MRPQTAEPLGLAAPENKKCMECEARSCCILAGLLPAQDSPCAQAVKRCNSVKAGSLLFCMEKPFTTLYVVKSGSVKTQMCTADGNLMVTGFFLPGDVVGLEALGSEGYPYDALAIDDTEVCELSVTNLLGLCSGEPALHRWLVSQIGHCLRAKDAALVCSTRQPTATRVLRFFVELHDRVARFPDAHPPRYPKPMKKHDIACYLSMAPETLSRTIGDLRGRGLLEVGASHFVVPDIGRARELTRI